MRIVLFDWTVGGHHNRYVRRFSEAMSLSFDVTVAIPDEMVDAVDNLPVNIFTLGKSRPLLNMAFPLSSQISGLACEEIDLLENVARELHPDYIIHLYADPIIRYLVERKPLNVPISLCIFFPRAHYPAIYNTPLSPREILSAWFLEYLVARWRRRSDAHSLFTLDEEAFRRWSKMSGVPVFWLPEPYVEKLPDIPLIDARSGCIVYGVLEKRKGIDLLARAISLEPFAIKVVIAGPILPGFENELMRCVRKMEQAGAKVDLRANHHNELEGLDVVAKAQCSVLSYPHHFGMSRVLLEACSVGTPVIVHDKGLMAHLVRQHGLGIAVDCKDPLALRHALMNLCNGDYSQEYFSGALARFTENFSKEAFVEAVTEPFNNDK